MDRPPGPKILVSVRKVAVSGGSNIVSFFEFIVGLIVDHQLSGFKYPLHPYHPGEAIWLTIFSDHPGIKNNLSSREFVFLLFV